MKTLLPSLLLLSLAMNAHSASEGNGGEKKKGHRHKQHYCHRDNRVTTAAEAKAIAVQETGGYAVSARQTRLNGATGGWEVLVHMPKEKRGWKCIVDMDTHSVYTKDRIDNPPMPKDSDE